MNKILPGEQWVLGKEGGGNKKEGIPGKTNTIGRRTKARNNIITSWAAISTVQHRLWEVRSLTAWAAATSWRASCDLLRFFDYLMGKVASVKGLHERKECNKSISWKIILIRVWRMHWRRLGWRRNIRRLFFFLNSILLVSSIQETIFNVWGREILLKDSNKGRSSEYKEERDLKRVYRSRTDRAQWLLDVEVWR